MDLTNLENIINGLTSFNTKEEVEKIIEDNNEVLVQLQRDQLSEGVDITGNERVDYYAPMTMAIKNEYGKGLGAVTDHVTFYMTGSLYESLFFKQSGDDFQITSPLETFDKMIDRISPDKYGLDEEKRKYFAEEKLLPQFAEKFKEITTLQI